MNNDNYGKNNIKKLFVDLFIVQYFSYLFSSLSQIINSLFVGNLLSSLDMVALGFYNPYQMILSVFSTVIASGSRIVCGKFIGRGNKNKVNEVFSSSIFLIIVFGLLSTILSVFFAPTIANLLGVSAASFEKTSTYIRAMGFGILPDMLVACLTVFLQMENESKYSLYSVLVLAVSTLSLNFLASKFFTFSILSVGLISSISKFIVLIFIILKFINNDKMPKIVKTNDYKIYNRICVLGLPSGIFNVLAGIRNIEINKATLLYGGDNAVNAISILMNSEPLFCGVAVGQCTAIAMLASVYYGEKDRTSIKQLFKVSLIFCELLTVVRFLVILLFTDKLALLFGATPEVIEYAKKLFLFYGLGMAFNIFAAEFISIYQSLGRTMYCNAIYFISVLLINLFCCRILSLKFGLLGVWFGYTLEEIVYLLLVFIFAFIKKKSITFSLDDLLFLDSDNLNIGDHITISINNIDDVMNVSKSIEEYCISQGVDKKRSMLSGLCLEELATNIIEHGFTKSKKKNNTIDIYCDVDDNTKDVNLRIKDNAVSFDPHIKLQNNNNDPTTNIGIRLVSKIAKDMNYQNNFGLNVLTIKL